MTADVFGEAPEVGDGEMDPLSPEHVVTLVRFLASPAAEDVNGQVFIVYGRQVTLMAAPTVEQRFTADAQAWDPDDLSCRRCTILCRPRPEADIFGDRGLVD